MKRRPLPRAGLHLHFENLRGRAPDRIRHRGATAVAVDRRLCARQRQHDGDAQTYRRDRLRPRRSRPAAGAG